MMKSYTTAHFCATSKKSGHFLRAFYSAEVKWKTEGKLEYSWNISGDRMWSHMVCWHISGSVDINKTSSHFKSTGFFIRNRWKCRQFVKVIIWWICKATLSMFLDLVSESAIHWMPRWGVVLWKHSLIMVLMWVTRQKIHESRRIFVRDNFRAFFLCPSWPYLQYLVMDLFLASLLGLRSFAPFQTFWLLIWRWLIFSTRSSTSPCTCFMQS